MLFTETIRQEIGTRLKQARENAGYVSAKEFCQKNNLPLSPYLASEKGEAVINALQLLEYSQKLQVSMSWVVLGVLIEKFPSDIKNQKNPKHRKNKTQPT